MSKKILILSGAVVLVGVALFLMLRTSSSSEGDSARGRSIFEMFSRSGGDSVTSVLMSGSTIDYGSFMEKLRSGEVNFVWELWAMRATCEEATTPEQCDEAIIAGVEKRLSSPEREQLSALIRRYLQYESKMREFEQSSSKNFAEKYAIVKKKRRELLGAEDSQLIFGMEESQVDFLDLAHQQAEQTKGLSGDERVRMYEELKRKTYGPYHKAITAREDRFAGYQNELELRQGDFAAYSAEDRQKRTRELEERYFGKAAAKAMAEARNSEQAEQKQLAAYEERAREYLAANPGAPESEKKARLKQLRVEVLGAEEAAAYERRKQFEETVSKIK